VNPIGATKGFQVISLQTIEKLPADVLK
jgi:hypothetical protein